MRFNKGLIVKLISVFTLVVLLGSFIYLYASDKALADDSKVQHSFANKNYEEFSGEKVLLNSTDNNLNGSWGTLELIPFIIQPTTDFFGEQINTNDLFQLFKGSSQWIFKDATMKDISLIFQNAGLSKGICSELLVNTSAIPDGKGFVTTPPDTILWSFTPEIRAKLYPQIGSYSDNIMYNEPICYNFANAEEWFYSSRLRKELIEKLLPLVYIENNICYISDIHLILPLVTTNDDWISLLQTLYRTRVLDAYLTVKAGEDISEISAYWGNLGRTEYIKPILERMSNNPEGGEINITDLLPSIPHSRLNTYSGIDEYITAYKNCHWTTINFFNSESDERFYNLSNPLTFMDTISKPLKNTRPKFGDIITIFDENSKITHSCTYIADNLVLTKNGMGNLNPFVLTYLDKITPLYGGKIVYSSRTTANTHMVDLEYLN